MAESKAHRWGQILGDAFEAAFRSVIASVAVECGVYLDYNGNDRPTRNGGVLRWRDENQNWHRLDYVLERGGTDNKVGVPAAFIEMAWRRYTKHSKNKVQEIEGAVLPLADTYRHSHPFLGAIVAGDFTEASLSQLRSRGFAIIYVPTSKVADAFASVGIDANSTESTTENEFGKKITQYASLSDAQRTKVAERLVDAEPVAVREFVGQLKMSLTRTVERIIVLPLHGEPHVTADIDRAIAFVSNYADAGGTAASVSRYEIEVRYSNGAVVRGSFPSKPEAVAFLRAQ